MDEEKKSTSRSPHFHFFLLPSQNLHHYHYCCKFCTPELYFTNYIPCEPVYLFLDFSLIFRLIFVQFSSVLRPCYIGTSRLSHFALFSLIIFISHPTVYNLDIATTIVRDGSISSIV